MIRRIPTNSGLKHPIFNGSKKQLIDIIVFFHSCHIGMTVALLSGMKESEIMTTIIGIIGTVILLEILILWAA